MDMKSVNLNFFYRLFCVCFFTWLGLSIFANYYISIIAFVIVKFAYPYLEEKYQEWLPVDKRSVLITGCDTGFGNHLANRLADDGFNVFATVLKLTSPGADDLRKRKLHNLHVIEMNVTNCEEIKAAVLYVNNKTKGKGLWGLVNNAGFNIYGDVEIVPIDSYKSVADVNLFGMISVTKAFLPQIRKSKGRIINVSSVMGRQTLPGNSAYQISKHGVETMSDSLRLEMKKFGVDVAIIEPGKFDGATACKSEETLQRIKDNCHTMWTQASEEVKAVYGQDYFYKPYELNKKAGVGGTSHTPKPVLDAIEDALLNLYPKSRYLIDGCLFDKYAIMARINGFLPSFVSDFLWSWQTNCGKSPRDQVLSL